MLAKLNRSVKILLGLAFLGAIVLFACTYTVRFTETAVKTTFGAAGEHAVKTEPGLYIKAPYPFQSVTKYDRRVRLVTARSESQQTADDFQIIVQAYMTYRVADPLKFFRRFSSAGDRAQDHYRKAEEDVLRDRLRARLGETSRYRMDQLFTTQRGASKLPELEGRIFEQLRSGGEGGLSLDEYGIEVVTVGIDRIVLPEETTSKVMDRMGANRDRLAERYESEGDALAKGIRAKADAEAQKIRDFAQRRAAEIEARGHAEAAPFLAQQAQDEELAVFLRQIDFIKSTMAKRFTLVLSTSDFGMSLFSPEASQLLRDGKLPDYKNQPMGGDGR